MKDKKIRFFAYTGNKQKYIKIINEKINKSMKDIYVEPFVGSGAILFNLEKEFDKYIINDIDRNIINMYLTFKDIDYDFYLEKINFIIDKFTNDVGFKLSSINKTIDNVVKSKENYYNFRNWFNKEFWNTNTKEEGIYCHCLSNMAINSKLRFGPNGINSAWGNRFSIMDESNFNKIKEKLNKTEIYNVNYLELFNLYPDALFYLDPPYMSTPKAYTNNFNETNLIELINIIEDKEYIYTDTINDINCSLPNKEFIHEMNNTVPGVKNNKTGNMEYIFYQIKELE